MVEGLTTALGNGGSAMSWLDVPMGLEKPDFPESGVPGSVMVTGDIGKRDHFLGDEI